MGARAKSKKARVRSIAWPWRTVLLTFAFCLFTFAISTRAHEPITTKVRFNKEVIRILQRNCLGCHQPGGIAFSLATYEQARPWAKAIKEEVLEKRMPPWRAMKGYGEFRNAPDLTQRDIDLLVNWVEGGAPKGDEKDLPATPLFTNDWALGTPDLILKPATETSIAAGVDVIRTFVLATDLKTDRWVRAVDIQPRNRAVAHCARVYLLNSGQDQYPPMLQVRNQDPAQDVQTDVAVATWMPGRQAAALDDGIAQFVGAGSRIAVSIHYRGLDEAATDLPSVGLYFAKSPPAKQLRFLPLSGPDSIIPPGDELHSSRTTVTIQADTEAVGIRPSVHPLMFSLQATAYRPDGSQEVLIWARGYQFDWSPTYFFKQRVPLPKGARVEVIAYFDNSDNNQKNPNNPAKPVRWSELTGEPLCVLLLADAAK
jgi:hypothetical protein